MTPNEVRARWETLTSTQRDEWVAKRIVGLLAPLGSNEWDWYSTNEESALSIIPKLGESFDLNWMPKAKPCGAWKAGVVVGGQYAEADTVAEAICLATLMYVERDPQPESHGDFKKMMHDLSDEDGKIDTKKMEDLIGDTTNDAPGSGERE